MSIDLFLERHKFLELPAYRKDCSANVYRNTTFTAAERAGRINPRIVLLALGMFALGTDAFVVAGVLPVIADDC